MPTLWLCLSILLSLLGGSTRGMLAVVCFSKDLLIYWSDGTVIARSSAILCLASIAIALCALGAMLHPGRWHLSALLILAGMMLPIVTDLILDAGTGLELPRPAQSAIVDG